MVGTAHPTHFLWEKYIECTALETNNHHSYHASTHAFRTRQNYNTTFQAPMGSSHAMRKSRRLYFQRMRYYSAFIFISGITCLLTGAVLTSLYSTWKRASPLQFATTSAAPSNLTESSTTDRDLETYLSLRADAREAFHVEDAHRANLHTPAATALSRHEPGSSSSSQPLTIAQYSHVYGPNELWMDRSGAWALCSRPCQAVGEFGDATSAADADVVILNLQSLYRSYLEWRADPHSAASTRHGTVKVGHGTSREVRVRLVRAATFLCFNPKKYGSLYRDGLKA